MQSKQYQKKKEGFPLRDGQYLVWSALSLTARHPNQCQESDEYSILFLMGFSFDSKEPVFSAKGFPLNSSKNAFLFCIFLFGWDSESTYNSYSLNTLLMPRFWIHFVSNEYMIWDFSLVFICIALILFTQFQCKSNFEIISFLCCSLSAGMSDWLHYFTS